MARISRRIIFPFLIVGLLVPGFSVFPIAGPSVRADSETRQYEDGDVIDKDTTWSGEVKVDGYLMITDGAVLTIRPGTEVRLGHIYVADGMIQAHGEAGNRIVFSKNPIDASGYSEEYDPRCFIRQDGMIEFGDTAERDDPASVLENVVFDGLGTDADYDIWNCPSVCFLDKPSEPTFFETAYAKTISEHNAAIGYYGGKVEIEKADFKNSGYLDVTANVYVSQPDESYDYLEISDSNFEGNSRQAALEAEAGGYSDEDEYVRYPSVIRLKNDWFGDASGPSGSGLSGSGEKLSGDYSLDGWSDHRFEDVCADCPSSVLFLPGIEASQLYRKNALGMEDRLWLPTPLSDDADQLRLDEDGKGESGIYAKDVIGKAYGVRSIYASFLDDLEESKSDEDGIKDYEAFAYDWRQDVEDIVENGTPYPDGERKYPVAEIDRLAAGSKSGQVTIIAHSNGGLLAKALMMELEKEGKASEVDRIVFVGTPQMGTPKAVLALLYGYDEELMKGLLMSRGKARQLALGIPGAYGLLPSEEYFARSEDEPVSFRSGGNFRKAYGNGLDDYGQFAKFLVAEDDGREKPAEDDLGSAAVLSKKLVKAAEKEHERLDAWTPPEGVSAIQIAGWGLDTVSGIEYREKEKAKCYAVPGSKVPSCSGVGEYEEIYDPKWTVDGDGTVVAPSALMMGKSDRIKKYWFDLHGYDNASEKNNEHVDLLEADPIRKLLKELVLDDHEESGSSKYIGTERPSYDSGAKPRIRMSLYSPLDIHLYDSQGNHTGPVTETVDGQETTVIEEEIPNSYYLQLDDRKYVGVPAGEDIRVELDGYASGSYSLEMAETDGETATATLAFAGLPTSADTQVSLDLPAAGLGGVSGLTADYDGDGQADYSVAAVPNGTADAVDRLDEGDEGKESDSRSDDEGKDDDSSDAGGSAKSDPSIAFLAKGMDSGGSGGRSGEPPADQESGGHETDQGNAIATNGGSQPGFSREGGWKAVLWMLAIGLVAGLLIMLRDILIKNKDNE